MTTVTLYYRHGKDQTLYALDRVHMRALQSPERYAFSPDRGEGGERASHETIEMEPGDLVAMGEERYFTTLDLGDMGQPTQDVLHTFPVIEERLNIHIDELLKGVKRLHKRTTTERVRIDEHLRSARAEIERVRCERTLKEGEEMGHHVREDGTLVIPIVEERLVTYVERVLVEEIHVHIREDLEEFKEDVVLRKTRVDLEDVTGALTHEG